MRNTGSIKRWAEGVRARLERARSARAAAPAPRPDPKLEPLEPRILLSADVGLVPEEALAVVALTPDLAVPQIEIHDEVLVRESSAPEPEASASSQTRELVGDGDADESAEAAEVSLPEDGSEVAGSQADADGAEQGDPGRADRALASLVWGDDGTADVEARELADVSQVVVIDGRVPEVESLLASLLDSTADLEAEPGADEVEPDVGDDAVTTTADTGDEAETASSAVEVAEALEARGIRVVVLDGARDGLDQVGEILEAFQGIGALHLVSHGSAGSLQLGNGRVTSETLQQRVRALRAWGRSLGSGADVLLYGCNVADGEVGIEFVSSLAAATGADVAASTDATGGDGHGDWDLEFTTGTIEATALAANAFAASLGSDGFTDAADAVGRDIVLSYNTGETRWEVHVGGTLTKFFATPSHGPGDPGVITIDGQGGNDTITLASVLESFEGTIELVGGAGEDTIVVEGVGTGMAGTVVLSGGDEADTLVLGDESDASVGLAGSFALQGGAGDDLYLLAADVWGDATITEAAAGGTDTLELGPVRTVDLADGGSITYADASSAPEQIEGVTVDSAALRAGVADLVAWATALQGEGELGQQLAGLSGTGEISLGGAMDLVDVFEQLRVYVEGELASLGTDLTVEEVQTLLEGFRAYDANELESFGSGLVGDVIDPDLSALSGAVSFTVDLDGTDVTLSENDPADLAALVSAFNTQLGQVRDGKLNGRVRAVAVKGVAGHERLGFEVIDTTARKLTLTATSDDAAALGFVKDVPREAAGLDEELKGLGDLSLNKNGWTGVGISVSGASPELSFSFHLEAVRKTKFAIDLGAASDDFDLGFDNDDTLELSSVFNANVELRLAGEPGSQTLEADLASPELSAEVLNGGHALGGLFGDASDPVDMNVGFLGAQVGPIAEQPEIVLHLAYRPGITWTNVTAGDVATQVAALTADTTGDADPNNDAVDTFRVKLPVEVKGFEGLLGSFETNMVIESGTDVSVLDGRAALDDDLDGQNGADAFESLASIQVFADLDPTTYIQLLGQIRGALDAVRQSDLFQSVNIPFVTGAVGKVADLADAFGDAVLFDDGDDGIDAYEDDVLVTRLNEQLRDAKMGTLVQFRVADVGDDTTKIQLVAISDFVDQIQITDDSGVVFNEDDLVDGPIVSDAITSAAFDAIKTSGFSLKVKVTQKGDAEDKEATLSEDGDAASSLRSIGNDVAKLLDESNEATFETAQELTKRLLEIIFPPGHADAGNTPFEWDGTNKLLTFDLEFSSDLIDVDLPVDFDLDLGPIGNIGIAEGSKITVGGDVTFAMTLGLNLGDLSAKEIKAEANDTTDLTSLANVDEVTDIIRLTPAITADRDPGKTVNDVEAEDADEFQLAEAKLADGVEITFGAAQNVGVVAESLINGVMNLTSPEDTRIHVDRYPDVTTDEIEFTGGRTVPLRDVPDLVRVDGTTDDDDTDDRDYYRLETPFGFEMRIDEHDGIGWRNGEFFTVSVADNRYYVNTPNAAKQKLLLDVEKAIGAGQGLAFDPVITRDTGTWAADGFAIGDVIRVESSGGNDGLFVIEEMAGDEIVVNGDLDDQAPVTSGSGSDDFTIVGPGRIEWANPADGDFEFMLGERIVLSGTEANDGIYLISRVLDGGDAIVVADFFDFEDDDGNAQDTGPNSEIKVTSNGAPVRVDPEAETEDATFTLDVMIGDTLTSLAVAVSKDGMKGPAGDREEGAASDLSNNRNLSDLAADVQNAIDEAIDEKIDELGLDRETFRVPEFEVRIDGTRLVIGLKNAAQLADGDEDKPALVFSPDGTIVRGAGTFEADGFAEGQLVLVHGAGEYDGEYVVEAVAGDVLRLASMTGTAVANLMSGVVITQTFRLGDANGVTNRVLGFTAAAGTPVTANLDDMVITTSDGLSTSVVLDGATTVYDVFQRIEGALGDAGMSASIALNEDKTGFDVTQTAGLGNELFEITSVNGSLSPLRLGILGADAMSDENEDGRIDQEDGDDVIHGTAVGGASLFDRFYIEEGAGIELALEVDTAAATASDAIEITGEFGFFEVSAEASGDVTAIAKFGLQDPVADPGADPGDTARITIYDLYEAFRDPELLFDMIDPREALTFGGATLDDDAGTIEFSDDGGEGRISRTGEGSWVDDRFKVDQRISVDDGQGHYDTFQILAIRDEGGKSILELDKSVGELKNGPAGDGDNEVEIESALATLTLKNLELPGGFESAIGLGDKRIVVSLLDLGNPFLNEVRPGDEGGDAGAFTAKDVILLLDTVEGLEDVEDGDTIEIEYEQVGGALVTTTALVKSVGGTEHREITLREGVDDASAGLKVEKVTVTRPVEIVVDTPDFGDLLDLSNIGWEQILDGLIALADFLDQFQAFEFLEEDIPLVGVSINDLLDYADQFRDMVNEIKADPAGSFQALEAKIEDLLGIDDGVPDTADWENTKDLDPFDITLEFVEDPLVEGHKIAKIGFDIGMGFRETLGVELDLGGAGILAGAADLEASGGFGVTLALGIDLTKTRVKGDENLELTLLHTDASGGDTITRADTGGSFEADGFRVGQSVEIDGLDGGYEIAEISADGRTITLSNELQTSVTTAQQVEASALEGDREVSIYDDTGIHARLQGKAEDLSFRAAVGPVGIFVQEDGDETAIDIGGRFDPDKDTNGDGQIDEKDERKIFEAGLKDVEGGRIIVNSSFLSNLFDHFEVTLKAGVDAYLPVAFPTDSLEQGRIELDADLDVSLLADDPFEFSLDLFAFDEDGTFLGEGDPQSPETVTDSGIDELFDLSALLDLGELSIFDNILLAVDGIDFFLGGLQDILDGEVFGIELPLIGDSLSEGAGFIQDLREGFLADFREGVEEAEDFAADLTDGNENVLSKLLFDVLSSTGLLLVELDDGSVVKATKAGLEAGLFELRDAIKLNEDDLPDLTGSINDISAYLKGQLKDEDGEVIEPEVRWDMKLGQNLLDVDTDLDIDLGVPGLGFEAEGPLGLKLGWDLDFGFGLNFDEGFFLVIEPEDGTDLEVNLEVSLPDRLAGQLAFLQLDAINDGSFLGGTFVVDVYNSADEFDEKLSFSELGKVRVRADIEAEALASFDMLLALNSDLIPSAPSVFPTVGADFVLDWGVGGHLKDAGQISVDGTKLTRSNDTWAEDGFLEGQRIILGGFGSDGVNGVNRIASIDGNVITLQKDTGANETKAGADLEISSLQDITGITGSLLMDGLNEVAFNDITLDLGSFIGDLIAPILGKIQDVTAPLQPVIDIMTSPIPVISEFAGDTSILDLAGMFGPVRPELLKAIADIITLANAIPTEKGEIKIPFGDFSIYVKDSPDAEGVDLSDPNFDPTTIKKPEADTDALDKTLDKDDGSSANSGANKKNKDFVKKLKKLDGFEFPFLQNPTEIFGLFTGEPVTLIGYDMPPLDFDFAYSQSIPLYPPLGLAIGGSFGAHIDFAFGFDTEGINQFAEGGWRNPLLIFNGLFVSDNPEDVTGSGPDLPELTFTGSFTVSAELNAFIARAGAGGGLFAEIYFDLFDPDHDGRVRILEIAENVETEFKFGNPILSPLAIFDVSGNVKARLFAFLEINLLLFKVSKEWDLVPPITLIDFDIDFQRQPKLASELPDGVLQLNMGDQAGQRLNENIVDGDEYFVVEDAGNGKVRVRAYDLIGSDGRVSAAAEAGQVYDRPTAIIALGGQGHDIIDFSGLVDPRYAPIRLEVEGGEGNDTLIGGSILGGGVFKGGLGDDVIVGTGGADVIYGGEGHDVIDGGAGDDILFADGGRIVEGEARVTREDLEVTPSRDEIHRDDNGLWLADGFRAGQTVRISGSTLAPEGSTPDDALGNDGYYEVASDWVGGALKLVDLEGGAANLEFERTDQLKIEIVNSEYRRSVQAQVRASDGDDLLLGGLGNDSVFGGGGDDVILGGGAIIAGDPDPTNMRSIASVDAFSNRADGNASRRIRRSFDPNDVEKDDAATDTHDILVGDAGEIRFRLGQTTPTFRDVIETNRGIFFGADEIHGNGGFDRIFAGQGDDLVHGGGGDDLIYGESGLDELRGDGGNDVVYGGRDVDLILGGDDDDDLYGNEGNDVIGGGAGADEIWGQSGSEQIWAGTGDDRVDGGGDFDTIYGGTGNDTLDGGAGDDVIFGDDADVVPDVAGQGDAGVVDPTYADVIFVGGGNDRLDGQGGSDEYIVNFRGAENEALIPIRDTGAIADGIDRLTANGTDFDDLFLLRRIQYFDDSTTPESEQFDAFIASINREGAVERIDFTGIDRVVVNGQQGDDEFAVDDVAGSTELNGGGGRDLFKVGQLYKSPRVNAREGDDFEGANLQVGDFFDTVETTRGWLSNGISEAAVINAGADNDEIIVLRNLAVLQVNGEEGDDSITVRAFALTRDEIERQKLLTEEEREALQREDTEIEGGAGADLIQYAVNAPVNIDGGDGLDKVTVIGTEFADDFVITEQGVYGAGLNVNLVNVELLTVDGAEGDDAFFVQSTQDGLITQLLGGLGSDTFDVTGDAPAVVSNDLLGHSGIITHGIESNDASYLGADGDGIAVQGISANVADDDEPFARITLTDGSTRIGEDGLNDGYYLTLTRRPEDDERVLVSVLAPSLTPEQKARGAAKFGVFSDTGRITATGAQNSSITVWFDASNWDDPLYIEVQASDDFAAEGENFGVINHQVRSIYAPGTPNDGLAYEGSQYIGLALPSVAVQIEDDDEADVLVFESDETTRAFEDAGTGADSYQVRLSRPPASGDVLVRIDVTPPTDVIEQISVSSPTGELDGETLVLRFSAGNWDQAQTVFVDGVPDDAREGFHRDFIQHTVEAAGDADGILTRADFYTPDTRNSEDLSIWPTTSVLLTEEPLQQVGQIGRIEEDGTKIFIAYGELEAPLVGHVVRLSSGPADGQARTIIATGVDEGEHYFIVDRAFVVAEGNDLSGSDFRTSDVTVTVDYRELSGTPDIKIDAEGNILRGVASGSGDTTSWKDDGFERNQVIVVEDGAGLLGRYVIKDVGVDGLVTERVVGDEGSHAQGTDSGWLGGVRVYVAPLEIDRFLVNSSTVVFLDENGRPETREASDVRVGYEYLEEGFDGRREERIAVQVVDDDTAGVLVTQTGSSTNVTEGGWVANEDESGPLPPTDMPEVDGVYTTVDTYEVVLTKQPVFEPGTEQAYVEVVVTPQITRTSEGSFAYDLQQVVVAEGEPGDNPFGDQVMLRFTAADWNVAQTVTVAAKQDGVIDGNDTQVFPEIPHTVANIQGPLFIDGRGGQGSLEGLTRPVMLDGEISQLDAHGVVQGIEQDGLVVERAALEAELLRRATEAEAEGELDPADYDEIEDLIGRTVELIDVAGDGLGAGDGDFTLITGITDQGEGLVRLDLDPAWDLSAEEIAAIDGLAGDDRYSFAITDESPNFFVVETDQVDLMRLNDEDNAADFEVDEATGLQYPNGFGRLTVFDPTAFPDTAGLLAGDDDPDGFGQGQWGRITGLGMSPDAYIARADRPGGITYGNLEGLEINLGLGHNHFTVDAVHQRNDGVRTYTVIDASDGDDVIEVSVAASENPEAGVPFLRIDAGEGDDLVTGSPDGLAPSTLDLEIIGGYGADTLIGGEGDDLIFGDFGETSVNNVVDLDAELALRQAARRGEVPDAGASGATPAGGGPEPLDLPTRTPAEPITSVATTRTGEGAGDTIYGMGGADRLFGGAGRDVLIGGEGADVLFGDYGRVNDETPTRRTIEALQLNKGAADSLHAGPGNDVLIGGARGDALTGSLRSDILIGDYVRLVFESARVVSATRLVGGNQDVAASSVFGLYAATPSTSGPSGRAPSLDRPVAEEAAPRAEVDAGTSGARGTSAGSAGSATLRGRHRVESGESLWAISERELGDPYRWPEVAKANEHLIEDPDVIEPSWVLRMPGAVTEQDAELTDAAAARENLAAIDERIGAQPRGWGFSAAGEDSTLPQVGEGPPDREAAPQRAPDETHGDAELPDQGANDVSEGDEPTELLGAVWAGLIGWQTRVTRKRSARGRERRWMAFDVQSGRFSQARLDTDRVAGDTIQ